MPLSNKKILLVDDMEDIRSIYTDVFEDEGAFVYTASDGEEALKVMKKKNVDLVVTDIIMPGMDGIQLILRIKEKFKGVPVLVMSGGGNDVDNLETSRDMGVTHTIAKPFSNQELIDTVLAILEGKAEKAA